MPSFDVNIFILTENFRPHNNETSLYSQYCKLSRQTEETAEEWMDTLVNSGNLCYQW